jgi:tetratricopeptide (TPR) repeat protein
MKIRLTTLGLCLVIGFLLSCQDEFLDKKQTKSLLVPTTLDNFQALLDNVSIMNVFPATTLMATDDFYTTAAELQTFINASERNSYIWATDIFEGSSAGDWNQPYQQILVSNVVLEGLEKYHSASQAQKERANQIKGAALFYRSMSFYHLLQQFALPYSASTMISPGVPLRLSSDINLKLPRAGLDQCYTQVLVDLKDASELLPLSTISKTRPGKQAALALLSRVYLSMGKYTEALSEAEAALDLGNTLLDFNLRSPNIDPTGNAEMIFNCANAGFSFAYSFTSGAPEELSSQYSLDDLRRQYYFVLRTNGIYGYRNMFSQNIGRFSGLSIDELYLVKAECEARAAINGHGLPTLNSLLVTRWKTATFVPFQANTSKEALKIILTERRKSLAYRGTRWTDLRRLNQEPELAVTLMRTLDGKTYTLLPNDKRYVYPIPVEEISASGIQQNIR